MGATVLHVASIVALFVDTVAATPVEIRCAQQPTPESWVKWLLPTIIQTLVSLASIGAGVGIAVWSFRRNRQSEHEQWLRNQNAGHEQWVRDQKKAEWKELLAKAAEIERVLPSVPLPLKDRLSKVANRLKPAVNRLSVARASSVFLQDFFESEANVNRFTSFIKDADAADTYIWAFTEVLRGSAEMFVNKTISQDKAERDLDEGDRKIKLEIERISAAYFNFIEWLRCEAAKDLRTVKFR